MNRVFLMLVFFLYAAEALAEITFEPPVKINDSASQTNFLDTYSSGQHSIAVNKGNIAIVWNDSRNGNNDVFFSFSSDDGKTFSRNTRVNDDKGDSNQWYGAVALDKNSTAYAVWEDDRDGKSRIYFAKREAKKDSFTMNIPVVSDKNIEQFGPAIAVNKKSEIYIAWHDNRNGNNDIFIAKSRDSGKSFEKPVRVDDTGNNQNDQIYPTIAVDNKNNVYIAWYDYRHENSDIYFAKSNDNGKTFSKNIKVNFGEDERGKTGQNSPSIGRDSNGNIYLTWEDKRNSKTGSDVYFSRLAEKGDEFEKNIHIDDEDAESSSQNYPSIAVNEKGLIVIAWDDDRLGASDIYLSYSKDEGKGFSKNFGLGIKNGKHRTAPSIAVDDEGNIYFIYQEWEKEKKGNDIYFVKGRIK
ncbi:MAG: exo-alpha-sialidase [Nitrospirae bacterium]|nr:exo-alpha-sialidase [Nitrospirota bacterium]